MTSGISITGRVFRFAACQFGQESSGSPLDSLALSVARACDFARLPDPIHVVPWAGDLLHAHTIPPHTWRAAPCALARRHSTARSRPRRSGVTRPSPSAHPFRTAKGTRWPKEVHPQGLCRHPVRVEHCARSQAGLPERNLCRPSARRHVHPTAPRSWARQVPTSQLSLVSLASHSCMRLALQRRAPATSALYHAYFLTYFLTYSAYYSEFFLHMFLHVVHNAHIEQIHILHIAHILDNSTF